MIKFIIFVNLFISCSTVASFFQFYPRMVQTKQPKLNMNTLNTFRGSSNADYEMVSFKDAKLTSGHSSKNSHDSMFENITFPCTIDLKVIGTVGELKSEHVLDTISKATLLPKESLIVRSRHSSKSTYVSITVTVYLLFPHQLRECYRCLWNDCPVKYVI
jgi:putative lipoic acid-binding regulatory protein